MEISVPIGLAREAHIAISRRDRPSSLRVPSCPLTGLFQGPQTVTLVDLEKVDGNTTLLEQLVILGLAKQRGVRAVFEFGTFDGKTAANLAATLGPDAEILTIDLPAHQEAALPVEEAEVVYIHKEQSGAKSRHFSNVFQLYGDTARFDFTLVWHAGPRVRGRLTCLRLRAERQRAGAAVAATRRPAAMARLRGLARRDGGAERPAPRRSTVRRHEARRGDQPLLPAATGKLTGLPTVAALIAMLQLEHSTVVGWADERAHTAAQRLLAPR
jgi:hypothetical protein